MLTSNWEFECLVKVLDQVLRVLEANTEPDEVVGHPEGNALLLLDGGVGHEIRQLSQTLVSSQRLSEGYQLGCEWIWKLALFIRLIYLQRWKELLALLESSLEVEWHHAWVSVALPLDQLVLGMGGKPRVADWHNTWMLLQPATNDQGVLLMLLHSDLEGLQGPRDTRIHTRMIVDG